MFITGDFNARVGQSCDYVENINVDRCVPMPYTDSDLYSNMPSRASNDFTVNNFGNRLLTLCKENDLYIVNGRLESGNYTCYNTIRNFTACSVVDYLITSLNNLSCICSMDVLYITEFSDHCPIKFSLHCNDSLLYQMY